MIDGATADTIRKLAKDVDEVRASLAKEIVEREMVADDVKLLHKHFVEMGVVIDELEQRDIPDPPRAWVAALSVVIAFALGVALTYGVIDFMDTVREHTPQ